MIPKKLVQYLFWLWGGAVNIGLDIGLLKHGRWNNSKIFLIILLLTALIVAINGTLAIEGELLWIGGEVNGNGTLQVASGAELVLSGGSTLTAMSETPSCEIRP